MDDKNNIKELYKMIEQIKLLELMSSRMFHDLAGPIGAVNNSLEFFEAENLNIREKALQIVRSSSAEAVLRLKFFRQAYGPTNDKEIALSEVQPIISEFLEKSKVKLNWDYTDLDVINSYAAKIILNFVVIALNAMIYGGVLEISQNNKELKIKFIGNNMIFSEETRLLLSGELTHITLSSANIQIYYTHIMMDAIKYKLLINHTLNEIEFILK